MSIPAVRDIPDACFEGDRDIYYAVVSNSTNSIQSQAFAGCQNLISIKIPSSVLQIAQDAFEGCEKLTIFTEEVNHAQVFAQQNGIAYQLIGAD